MSSFNQLILLKLGQIDIEFSNMIHIILHTYKCKIAFKLTFSTLVKKQVLLILNLFMLANNSFIYLKNALAALITFDYNWLED